MARGISVYDATSGVWRVAKAVSVWDASASGWHTATAAWVYDTAAATFRQGWPATNPTNFQQTDTSAGLCTPAVFCSGKSLNTNQQDIWKATKGGTAGSAAHSLLIDASATDKLALWWEIQLADQATWDGGTWTVRLNVTTASSFLTWNYVIVCRVNSSCVSQATMKELTGLGISLSTTGVKSQTLSNVAAQTPSAGDKIQVVLGFSNSSGLDKAFSYKNTELIDTSILS